MIIRISRGNVQPDAEGEVVARLRAATEGRERPDGLHALFIGRQLAASGMQIVAITVWEDADSLIRVLGDGWEGPKWLAGVDEHVTGSTVEHWETAIESFDPESVFGVPLVGSRSRRAS